jgi:hypothetical protein
MHYRATVRHAAGHVENAFTGLVQSEQRTRRAGDLSTAGFRSMTGR